MTKEKKPHPQIQAVERALRAKGLDRPALYRALNVYKEQYQNWKTRGIPAGKLHEIADYLGVDAKKLKKGVYSPVEPPELAREQHLSDEAYDMAIAYENLPEGLQRHIRTVIDDYLTTIVPTLGELYQNRSHADQDRANRLLELAQRRDLDKRQQE